MDNMLNPNSKLTTYFSEYLLECEYTKRLSIHTINSYKDVMKNFLNLMPEVKCPMDLKPYIVHEFFKRLGERAKQNKKELKTSTIRTYFNKLIVFFKWLESNDFIQDKSLSNKIIKPPNPQYTDEKALNEEQVSKIVSAISLYNIENELKLYRDLTIVKLLLYTGIRKGELLGLQLQDVDFGNKTLFINGRISKSKKSRTIPLHFSLLTVLKFYFKLRQLYHYKSPSLLVSTKKDKAFTAHGMKHWVKKYNEHSGVKFHLHQFRHTFACNLAIRGTNIISIKNLLGHATTQMTEQYLRSIQNEDARSQIDALEY